MSGDCLGFLNDIEDEIVETAPLYSMIAPTILGSIGKRVKMVGALLNAAKVIKTVKIFYKSDNIFSTLGDEVGKNIIQSYVSPVKREFSKLSIRALRTSGRSWMGNEDSGPDGRVVKKAVLVYHDASKAGKHLDLHIGHLSLVFRIDGKDVIKALKFGKNGRLIQSSREALIDHLKVEVSKSTRTPQNLDHSASNARFEWFEGSGPKGGSYGSGKSRQIIIQDDVEVVKSSGDNLRLNIPFLNKNGQIYIHRIHPGTKERPVPIVNMGIVDSRSPEFRDRLHLKAIKPQEIKKFISIVDASTVTKKEDGASTHFKIGKNFSTFWSPRISRETGRRIEYSSKIPELFKVKSDKEFIGMGELKFRNRLGRELSSTEISGILNSDKLRSRFVIPELRLYRIDRVGGVDVSGMSFHENRKIQKQLARLNPLIKLVQKAPPKIKKGIEGLVGVPNVPKGGSINDGIKIKFVDDPDDWRVLSVNIGNGPAGRMSGVVWFESLTSGKKFKLGPGQLGDEVFVKEMMIKPDDFIGKIYKVTSRYGHEGRASKLICEHMDK